MRRRWARAGGSGRRTSSASMPSPNHSKKSCANNANPERHGNVRSLSGVWWATGEGAGTFRRAGATRPPSHGSDGRLGSGKTLADARTENHRGALALRMAAGRKWSASYLCADVDALPHSELESGGQALLPGAAAEFRCCAHIRAIRPAGSRRSRGLPQTEPAVCARTHGDVRANCAESLVETHVSCGLGKASPARRKRGDRNLGAGSRGTRGRWVSSNEGGAET